jgi:hypothetical protein
MIAINLIGITMTIEATMVSFPLQEKIARKIVQDLALTASHKIRFGSHAKERMIERGINTKQVMTVLQDNASRFTEKPHLTASASWKFNLQGFAAGEIIEVVVDLRNVENNPNAFIVTVILK